MGRVNDMWIGKVEQIAEDYAIGKLEEGEVIAAMQTLGFTEDEADEHLAALKEDCGE